MARPEIYLSNPEQSSTNGDEDILEVSLELKSLLQPDATVEFGRLYHPEVRMIYDKSDMDVTALYMREISKHPILTAKQEEIIFEYLKTDRTPEELIDEKEFVGDFSTEDADKFLNIVVTSKTIKDVIINCNQRMVVSVAKNYGVSSLLENIQEGNIGLMRAVEGFDPTRGVKLSTYAHWWIRQAISRAMKDKIRTIRIPVHMEGWISRASRIAQEFYQENGRNPKVSELVELMVEQGFGPRQAESVIRTVQSGILQIASLDKFVGDDESELGDFIPDGRDLDKNKNDVVDETSSAVIEEAEKSELETEVERVLDTLNEPERQVIKMHYGFEGEEATIQEVGDKLGITSFDARRLEHEGLNRLRLDFRLQQLWSDMMPGYAYYLSAEETAFRMGLLESDEERWERLAERAAKRERQQLVQSIIPKISFTERPSQTDNIEEINKLIEWAKQNPEVWNQLAEHEQGILPLYFRRNSSRQSLKDSLAIIFGTTTPDLEVIVDRAIERITQLVKASISRPIRGPKPETLQFREEVKRLRDEGIDDQEIARRLDASINRVYKAIRVLIKEGRASPIHHVRRGQTERTIRIDNAVESLIKENPELSNGEIAEKLALDSGIAVTAGMVKSSRERLYAENRIERPKKLKEQVEELRNQGLTNIEIAERLSTSYSRVQYAASILIRTGRIQRRSSESLSKEENRKLVAQVRELQKQGVSNTDIATKLNISSKKVANIASSLIRAGEIERLGPSKGLTVLTKEFDELVEKLVKECPSLTIEQIANEVSLMLGRRVTKRTVQRARVRLIAQDRIGRKILTPEETIELDNEVERRLRGDTRVTYKEIAASLAQPVKRIITSAARLREAGRVLSRASFGDTRTALEEILKENNGQPLNLSEIGRQLGISRERIRQLYNQINQRKKN